MAEVDGVSKDNMDIEEPTTGEKKFDEKRYVDFLQWIQRHDFVTANHIAKYEGITPRGARMKLSKLKENGYLDTYNPSNRKYSYNYHFITSKAGELIKRETGLPDEKIILRWSDPNNRLSIQNFYHIEGINDYFLTLIDQSRPSNYPGCITWLNSRECHVELPPVKDEKGRWIKETIIPDGFGEFATKDTVYPFYFEYDRATESLDRIIDKFRKYILFAESDEIFEYEYDQFPMLLFLTNAEGNAINVKKYVEDYAIREGHEDALRDNYFFVSWSEDINSENLLEKKWTKLLSNELYSSFRL